MFAEKVVQMMIISCLTIKAETPPIVPGGTTKSETACEGRDQQLFVEYYDSLWHDWYFNTTMICQVQGKDEYHVNPSYNGKVEKCNKMGIHLRNLSLTDSGDYSLQSYREEIQNQYKQMMSLTVLAAPTKGCTPSIEMHSKDVLKCSTSCGNLDPEWRLDKTGTTLWDGSFLHINCSWKVEHLWCCPQGPNMRCYQGNDSDLCASVNISSLCSEDSSIGNDSEIHPAKAPDSSGISLVVVTAIGVIIVIIIIIVTVIIFCCCVRKSNKQQQTSQLATNQTVDSTHIELSGKELDQTILQLEKETEDFTPPLPSAEAVPLLEDKETANDTLAQLSNHTASQKTTNQTANSTRIQNFEPEHKTEVAETTRELQELRDAAICKICFASEMSMIFMPCSHIATCDNCSISLQKCPVCRTSIEKMMKIHFDK